MDIFFRLMSLLFLLFHFLSYIHAQSTYHKGLAQHGGLNIHVSCEPYYDELNEARLGLYYMTKAALRAAKADPSSPTGQVFSQFFLSEDRELVQHTMIAILRAINRSGPRLPLLCNIPQMCADANAGAFFIEPEERWEDAYMILCFKEIKANPKRYRPVTDYCAMEGRFNVSLADVLLHEMTHWSYLTNFTIVEDLVYNPDHIDSLVAGQLLDAETQAVLLPRNNAQNYMMLGMNAKFVEIWANASWCAPGGPGGFAAAKADTAIGKDEEEVSLSPSSTSSKSLPSPAASDVLQIIDHGELRLLKGIDEFGGDCTVVPDAVTSEASTPPTATNDLPTSTPTADWQSTLQFNLGTQNATAVSNCSSGVGGGVGGANSAGADGMGHLSPVGYVHVPLNSSDFYTDPNINVSAFRELMSIDGGRKG